MYLAKHFEENDARQLHEFIAQHPLATFVTENAGSLEANHIPMLGFERDGKYFLAGHVARANLLWEQHPADKSVLAIFQSENCYISPSWYTTKAIHHKVVPTWNYVVVHAHGKIKFIEDTDWLIAHLEAITHQHELNLDNPWKLSDAPAEFIQKLSQAIVGFEIEVTELKGKRKLNQNRSVEDRESVMQHLRNIGKDKMADLIDAALEKL